MKRPWLAPLNPLYGAVVARKNRMWDRDPSRAQALQWPVVSVGSLSAGGAGKTPVVAALAVLLRQGGYGVDILSRGYGRRSKAVERVDPKGDAAQYGDEPLMLAQGLGVPVYVGADRAQAGRLAEAEPHVERKRLHLLDDGFQHRGLRRQMDVVLLTLEDVCDALLPGGNLREPLASLERADAIVVREEEEESLLPYVKKLGKPFWTVRRSAMIGEEVSSPLVFCGLARSQSFLEMVLANKIVPAKTKFFPDHHRYTQKDVDVLVKQARAAGARGWVTSAKDMVKLTPLWRAQMEAVGPVVVMRLDASFVQPAAVLEQIEQTLEVRR